MAALDEAQLHREAASRKKRELAILAAQEIAYLSHVWGERRCCRGRFGLD